eukprot:scaffold4029_cov117-Isochrysis_galbana.AAC.6
MSYAERLGNLVHRLTASTLIVITCAGLVHISAGFAEIITKARKFKAEKKALKEKAEREQ